MISTKKMLVAAAAALGMSSAFAVPSLTNSTGTYANFGGFDWASNGTALVENFDPTAAANNFTLTYWASAATVTDILGATLVGPTVGILTNLYEYTIRVTLNETSSCTSFVGPACVAADFQIAGGAFDVWYDTNKNANQVTGAGITDGDLLFSGVIGPQLGGAFNVLTGGNATLFGAITFTNLAYISEELSGTTATSTLQIGGNVTNWAAPTSMPGAAGGTQALPAGSFGLQADANQSVRAVPEPASLALLGLGLVGLGLARSRKQKAA